MKMAAILYCRAGDPQALKPAAAAAAAGVSLTVSPLSDAKKALGDSCSGAQLALAMPDGSALADANAAARYLGEPCGSSRGVHS